MMPSRITPQSAPRIEPLPPLRLIRPITAAAKTVKIMFWPWPDRTEAMRPVSISPESAARPPAMTNTVQT